MPKDYSATLFVIGKWHTKIHKKVIKEYKLTSEKKFKKVIKKYNPTTAEKSVVEDGEDIQQIKESYMRIRSEEARLQMRMRKPGRINMRGIADMNYHGTGSTYPFRK